MHAAGHTSHTESGGGELMPVALYYYNNIARELSQRSLSLSLALVYIMLLAQFILAERHSVSLTTCPLANCIL